MNQQTKNLLANAKNIKIQKDQLEIMATEQCSKCCSSSNGGNPAQKLR